MKRCILREKVYMTSSQEQFIKYVNNRFPNPTLTDKQIATLLGVHTQTIYRMRLRGQGPKFAKISRNCICLKQDFFDWFFSCYSKNECDTVEKKD